MRRISSADFVRNFSAHTDTALAEPLVLTRNGRDRLVVLSMDRYQEILGLAVVNGEGSAELGQLAEQFRMLSPEAHRSEPKRSSL